MLIVDDLLSLAVKGYFGIFKKIHDMAIDEIYSQEKIGEQLLGLQELLQAGEITEKEYEKQEAELLQRLETAKKRR